MIAVDTNLLVYAHRSDLPRHQRANDLIQGLVNGAAPWAVPGEVLVSFLWLVTNRRIFKVPTPLPDALAFVRALTDAPTTVVLSPGDRHLQIFLALCERSNARAKLVPDASLAALAIEHGCEWWSADRDFARFHGLRWRNPLDH